MIFRNNAQLKTEKGFAIFYLTVLVLAAALTASASIFTITYREQRIIKDVTRSNQAYFAAEAGMEDATLRIKKTMDVPSKYTLIVGTELADIQIISPNSNTRIVQSTGTASNISRKIENRLSIETINPSFFYGAQAGNLGILMENNSRIEGAGGAPGNVYSNGPISGDNNAVITGNVFVATGMAGDQSYAVYNSDQIFGKNNPVIDVAQSFVPSVSNTLVKISIYIKRVGDPNDLTVRILTDNLGSPTKTVLASGGLEEDLVGTSFGWVDIVFSSPPNLTQGVTYWLAIDASTDNNDYWVWGKDQNQGYVSGQAKYSQDWNASNPSWTAIAGDLNFKTYMGGQATFLDKVAVLGDAHSNTITNSDVCGSAFYQTIDSSSLDFLNSPHSPACPSPLTPGTAFPESADPPLQNMPISDSNIN
ncbi:MAG: choice-of-anchor R domain-containing protein, partial [bacterium]|nr:choice-of-anchor R domain-containing protein [bacterium]